MVCTDVEIHAGGSVTRCETKGDLERALGGRALPINDGWPDESCLCPLDVEKTAARYGYAASSDGECIILTRLRGIYTSEGNTAE